MEQKLEEVCRRIYPQRNINDACVPDSCQLYPRVHSKCRIIEKTEKQLDYVKAAVTENTVLRACPGSGKTEVIGIKAAHEFQSWGTTYTGIAILTFTNAAADVIKERVQQFAGIEKTGYPHYIGTIDSWLHGYLAHPFAHLVTNYQGIDGDKSIRVVEDNVSDGWINNYRCRTQYHYLDSAGNSKSMPLYSNNIRFDPEKNRWEIKCPNSRKYWADEDYYYSAAVQKYVNANPWFTIQYLRNGFDDVKKKFMQDGFGTYHDIEWICYRLLQNMNGFAGMLSKRFPAIIIDECQDLSWIQLEIFGLLEKHGTTSHLVGDLNQSIYEFKKVDPEKVNTFVSQHSYKTYSLSDNYRSCQPIVDLCQALVDGEKVVGKGKMPNHQTCVYFLYKKEELSLLPVRFKEYLKNKGISAEKSVIMARGWAMVYSLISLNRENSNKLQCQVAMAMHLWSKRKKELVDEALKHIGKFMACKYFTDRPRNANRYHCPDMISSPMRWRLFLAHILDECMRTNCEINDLNQTWQGWANCIRQNLTQIVESSLYILQYDLDKYTLNILSFSAPKGYAQKKVVDTLKSCEDANTTMRITTIHSVKGKTFDAVLLVSSPDAKGSQGGCWNEWLKDKKGEPARFAYVASSRPKKLLAWAVPETADLKIIEGLGFCNAIVNEPLPG